jgi:hypothetical protein
VHILISFKWQCCDRLVNLLILDLLLGISAVCPYLALETCRQWRLSNKTVNLMRNGKMPTVTIEQAQRNFIKVWFSIACELWLYCCMLLCFSSFVSEHSWTQYYICALLLWSTHGSIIIMFHFLSVLNWSVFSGCKIWPAQDTLKNGHIIALKVCLSLPSNVI